MREDLLSYYENELTFLRQMGAEFAQRYPKIASRLVMEPDRCEDPHTERLLEAFAFLAARVHLKVDDEFPEITTALLDVVYPHYLRPIPSMSVVEFHIDPDQGKLSTCLPIPKHTMLHSRGLVDGVVCKFQTCYDTALWPVSVEDVQWSTPDRIKPAVGATGAVAVIKLSLRCLPDASFAKLPLSSLLLYLNGESNVTGTLYELLCNNCLQILVRDPASAPGTPWQALGARSLRPIGFDEGESLLPYPKRSFAGYRLLQEYFAFPEKFLFCELSGLDMFAKAGIKEQAEILFLISKFDRPERQQALETGVSNSTFRLNCTPVINLFPQTAEPILLDQTRYEYPVVPDARRSSATEVFSVDSVVCTRAGSSEVKEFAPFYSYRRQKSPGKHAAFWHATRRSADFREDPRTDVYLSLVDDFGQRAKPDADTITVRCTCTNSDLPSRLPFGNASGDFELEGLAAIRKIIALRKPTSAQRPPNGKRALWNLISHLSLNYLSLVEQGRDAFQGILRLYNFSDLRHVETQIAGISTLSSSRHFARVASDDGVSSARGVRVQMEFDEEQFVGSGVYLFASVLEHFLGMYVSMNSFSQLVASTPQRKGVMKEWPPRAGRSILV